MILLRSIAGKPCIRQSFMLMRKFIKPIFFKLSGILFLLILAFIIWANYRIVKNTDGKTYSDVNLIPENKVGLLLGTSKNLGSGLPNRYFDNRIDAAVQLFEAGKIKFLVISGDNSRVGYNEPLDMKNALMASGVPDSVIYLDYAGFRTYDSMIRMHEIFGQSSFTVISQEFHNRRAIYIGEKFNLNVVGFNARDVDAYNGFKTKVREKLARVKVFIDLLIHKKPRFLGEKIEIG